MGTAILAYLAYLTIVLLINSAVFYHFFKYSFPGDIIKSVIFIYAIVVLAVITGTFLIVGII